MKVTGIVFDSYAPKDKGTCAECSIVLDSSICIHKIHIVNGDKGLFVAFPNTGEIKMFKNKKRYTDIVHPVSRDLFEDISSQVLDAYNSHTED